MAKDTKINDLIEFALRRNVRRNTEVESIIKGLVEDWLKDILSEYPFWFLNIEPGYTFPKTLPLSQVDLDAATPISILGHPTIDYWLDRGILRTEAGKDVYRLFAPTELHIGDTDGNFWVEAKSQKPLYVYLMSLKGAMQVKLAIPGQHIATLDMNATEGTPSVAYIESGREGDYLRLVPCPDKGYIIHIAWVLAESLKYFLDPGDVALNNWTSKFIQEYTEAVIYGVMLKTAEYFGDVKQMNNYKEMLYGNTGNSRNNQFGGKLGNIKREHLRKAREKSYSIGTYKGNPMNALGPGQRRDPWGRFSRG